MPLSQGPKVRRRTLDNLAADVAVLAHYHPALLAEVRAILCDEADPE
ncbi:hypothetical protein [Natrinema soli]|uniref:Uncharacterized protein n=1 Tax=Natrinema soli TaxID=1930624 RepID=A0ABD5SZS2_9EURY|nr:hypothetical protein [Natrinema soli]